MEQIKTYAPGDAPARKGLFNKMFSQAKNYRDPDQELQAKVILNAYFELQKNSFSVTVRAMVSLLRLYRDYTEPSQEENLQTASLKVANRLVSAIRVETFAAVKLRASQLNIPLHTQRQLPAPAVEFDLSDEEEVPLSTNSQFTSHRSVILDEKDGLRDHLAIQERIRTLAKERTLVREWDDDATKNKPKAAKVVFAYAKKKCDHLSAAKVQQYLLRCISHCMRLLQELDSKNPASQHRPDPPVQPWKGTAASPAASRAPTPPPRKQRFHSSGIPVAASPPSGLGREHDYNDKVVNSCEVQLTAPRVPHPVTRGHAIECMSVVSEIEHLQLSSDNHISSVITDKIVRWLCPPGFAWSVTFNTPDKRKQAYNLVKESTEILNMRVRREATARDMAQKQMDASAKGTFNVFRYDIEREYQLLCKFRRSLFVVELGAKAASELEEIRRIQKASLNSGIGTTERSLFDKLMKARLNSVVEQAAKSSATKKKANNSPRCGYCKKRHAGGSKACRKRKTDVAAAAVALQPPVTQSSTSDGDTRKRRKTDKKPPSKRAKISIVRKTEEKPPD
jgi:hypothetical protein